MNDSVAAVDQASHQSLVGIVARVWADPSSPRLSLSLSRALTALLAAAAWPIWPGRWHFFLPWCGESLSPWVSELPPPQALSCAWLSLTCVCQEPGVSPLVVRAGLDPEVRVIPPAVPKRWVQSG